MEGIKISRLPLHGIIGKKQALRSFSITHAVYRFLVMQPNESRFDTNMKFSFHLE